MSKKILVVEGADRAGAGLAAAVASLGYAVEGPARNGEDAVRLAMAGSADLVLFDLSVGGSVRGPEAAAKIASSCRLPLICVPAPGAEPPAGTLRLDPPVTPVTLRAALEPALFRSEVDSMIRRSRELLFSTLRSVGDAVAAADAAGRVTFLNSAAETLTGWSAAEASGLPLSGVLCLRDEATGEPLSWPASAEAAQAPRDALLASRDGTLLPVEVSSAPVGGPEGESAGMIVVFHDVAEKRRVRGLLKRSRQKYDDIFENSSDIIFSCDASWRLVSANAAALKAFGYSSRAELLGAGLDRLFPGRAADSIRRAGDALRMNPSRQGAFVALTVDGLRRDGSRLTAELRFAGVRADGLQCVARDVTEERRARGQIEMQAFMLEQVQNAVAAIDMAGNVVYCNDYFAGLVKADKKDFIGRKADRLKEFGFRVPEPWEISAVGYWDADLSVRSASGSEVPVHVVCSLLRDSDGTPSGVVIVGSDITRIKRVESRLRRSEEKYRRLYNEIPVMLILSDIDGHVLDVNNCWCESTGFSRHEVVGRNCRDLTGAPVPAPGASGAPKAGIAGRLELKAGGFLDCVFFRTPEKNDAGATVGWMTACLDVTARVRAEEALRQKEAQLRHTQKMEMLGQLISGVAHELNNPLASIMGYSQLLAKKRGLGAENRDDLKQVAQSADQCRRIVENLLRFVRKDESEAAPAAPAQMVARAMALLRYKIKKSGLNETVISVSKRMKVVCKAPQLEQVIVNLVSNALDAMVSANTPKRRLAIKAEKRGGIFRLRVANTGPDIPEEMRERVFEPFFTTKGSEGTGLGLALCRQIVEERGGRIWNEPAVGGGVVFVVELPERRTAARAPGKPRRHHDREPGLNILVVDDETRVSSMIAKALEPRGNRVAKADSVASASELLLAGPYDLVLSDVVLEDGSGLDLYEKFGAGLPFLFMTGNVLDPALQAYFSEKGVDFLRKPFDLEELYAAVSRSARKIKR